MRATTAKLRKGDVVEVRSAAEILATLDDRGELDALPFMPEMVAMCGRRYTVGARAERVCDTVTGGWASRSMTDTVVLDTANCDGSGHGGCAAACLIYWKESWLRPVDELRTDGATSESDDTAHDALLALVLRNVTNGEAGESMRFRCQATQAIEASHPISGKDPRS